MEISEHIGCDPLVPLMAGMAAVCGAPRRPHPAGVDARVQGAGPVDLPIGEPGTRNAGLETDVRDPDPVGARGRPRFAKAAVDFEVSEASLRRGQEAPH